jgi:hypothetical protein
MQDPYNQTQQSPFLAENELRTPLASAQIFQACWNDYFEAE